MNNPRIIASLGSRSATRWILRCSIVVGLAVSGAACAAPEDVEAQGESGSALTCNVGNATRLASIASRMNGQSSQHLCYRYVKAHLRGEGFPTATLEAEGYGGSAFQFAVWAKKSPSALAKMGLRKVSVGLDALPKGAVIVWRPGQCGYNATHGHIEVVVDDNSSRACSDFCGNIKKNCGAPDVFVPSGCISTPSTEADDDDTSEAAPAGDNKTVPVPPTGPTDPSAPAPAPTGGGCYSSTMQEQMPAGSCVQSQSSATWFQCNAGKWYRGVTGDRGPFGTCTGMHAL